MVRRSDLITWREACRRLGIKRRTLQYAVGRGELEAIRVPIVGRRTEPMYRPADVRALKQKWRTA